MLTNAILVWMPSAVKEPMNFALALLICPLHVTAVSSWQMKSIEWRRYVGDSSFVCEFPVRFGLACE